MAFDLECIEVVLATIKEDMFPCIRGKGVANRTSNGRKPGNTKEELFASIAHVLVIAEFEEVGNLRVSDSRLILEIIRGNVINVYVCCPFCYVWEGIRKFAQFVYIVILLEVWM
jgi:hypothetical protein